MKHLSQEKKNKGFTLLFAVLVSVLVLAVGASVITIALKQTILSSTGRESQYAFYAANTGLECALFWDLNPQVTGATGVKERVFPYIDPEARFSQTNISDYSPVVCGATRIENGEEVIGSDIAYTGYLSDSDENRYVFQLAIRNTIDNGAAPDVDDVEYCAEVTVDKASSSGKIVTTITSQGLNTCDPDSDPRAVQRGLIMQYNQ